MGWGWSRFDPSCGGSPPPAPAVKDATAGRRNSDDPASEGGVWPQARPWARCRRTTGRQPGGSWATAGTPGTKTVTVAMLCGVSTFCPLGVGMFLPSSLFKKTTTIAINTPCPVPTVCPHWGSMSNIATGVRRKREQEKRVAPLISSWSLHCMKKIRRRGHG